VGTYEAAELLEALEHACNDECSAIPALRYELGEVIVDSADFGMPTRFVCLRNVSVTSGIFFFYDLFFDFSKDSVD
jgi:hypothetical protein